MSNTIPTAEELIKSKKHVGYPNEILLGSGKDLMIEFAKIHVKAALKSAERKVDVDLAGCSIPGAITNSYPLDNIK